MHPASEVSRPALSIQWREPWMKKEQPLTRLQDFDSKRSESRIMRMKMKTHEIFPCL
jgi:hypothetical protein